MRDNGVNLPDNPGQGGGAAARQNIDQTKLQAAQKACEKYRAAVVGNITPADRQQFRDAAVKFAACMRQNGVNLPDPGSGNGPPAGGVRQILDQNDPKVKAATAACKDKMPKGGFRGPAGGR
jgi:hypothetical protein